MSTQTMIERLQQTFEIAERFSEEEQGVLAAQLLEEMEASKRWDTLFADLRSDLLLERLVGEALAEDRAGETEEICGDDFTLVKHLQ